MMQPYRLAMFSGRAPTCLDPPTRVCETPAPSRFAARRFSAWLVPLFALAAGTSAFAAHLVARRGHVEIAPAAIAHARGHASRANAHRQSHATPPVERPRATTESRLLPTHALLGGTHDKKALLANARSLQTLGLDLTVIDVPLGRAFAAWPDTRPDFWPSASRPVFGPSHHVDGIELRGIPAESPLRVAGLADGDQLLGIDGYRLDDDTFRDIDVLAIRKRGAMVVEIARADHHIALSIHWPTQ